MKGMGAVILEPDNKKMSIITKVHETLKRKYEKPGNKLFSQARRKKLTNCDFSIISNNCWGGYVYRYFGLPYSSPTVGLYFYPDDYLQLLTDIRGYLETPLTFIKPSESKHYKELIVKKQTNIPIGRIRDVEIVFLHYKSEREALQKWARRVSRVNYDNMIVKFSQMNGCNSSHLQKFDDLSFDKMFMFVNSADLEQRYRKAIYFRGQESFAELHSDTTFFNNYIDLYELINSKCFPKIRR